MGEKTCSMERKTIITMNHSWKYEYFVTQYNKYMTIIYNYRYINKIIQDLKWYYILSTIHKSADDI